MTDHAGVLSKGNGRIRFRILVSNSAIEHFKRKEKATGIPFQKQMEALLIEAAKSGRPMEELLSK